MPRPRLVRKESLNGEIHVILPESPFDKTYESEDFDVAELKKIMKKEASKPLLLLRAE